MLRLSKNRLSMTQLRSLNIQNNANDRNQTNFIIGFLHFNICAVNRMSRLKCGMFRMIKFQNKHRLTMMVFHRTTVQVFAIFLA